MATRRTGTTGADTITAVDAADTLAGGAGNDLYIVNSLLNVIEEFPTYYDMSGTLPGGIDTVRTAVLDRLNTFSLSKWANVENLQFTGTVAAMLVGNSANNVIQANSASVTNDTLSGGVGNDTLYGYGGNDSLIGGTGDDLLDGGVGSDTMIGGAGNDTYVLNSVFDVAIETATGGIDTLSSSAAVKDLRVSKYANFENLIYTHATVAASLNGDDGSNLVDSRSAGNDTLYGWAGNDTLIGGAGNDSLLGAEGDDSLVGGSGVDTLIGGNGDDVYAVDTSDVVTELADGGEDTLIGTKTSLALTPAIENLGYTGSTGASLVGNALDNKIGGGVAADSISTGAGNDSLYGGNSAGINYSLVALGGDLPIVLSDQATDTLIGGLGDDHYFVDDALDVVVESVGAGDDVLESFIDNSLNQAQYANVENLLLVSNTAFHPWFGEGNAGANVIVGSWDENYLAGGAGDDTLAGNPSQSAVHTFYDSPTDVLDGGDGNDVLLDSGYYSYYAYLNSSSILLGGAGNDFYVVDNPDTTEVYDSLGTDTVYLLRSGNLQTAQGVERIVLTGGGTAAEYTKALDARNAVARVAGGDPISVLSDSSAINATGNDDANTIVGNAYGNNLVGLAGNDTIYGNAGNDTLDGGAGNDSLIGGFGDDTYVLTTGDVIDELPDQGLDTIKSSTLTSVPVYTNIEGFEYSGSSNVLLEYAAANTTPDLLTGGSGNDTINGYGGNDTLNGGLGNDSLTGGDAQDSLTGGDGADRILGEAGDDYLHGGIGIDTLDGGAGNDQLWGEGNNDSILGGIGADTIYGDDSYYYSTGGATGNDTIDGGADNDYIYGGNGNDSILGGAGADMIYGDDSYGSSATGNDTIDGGADNDQLYGGGGDDSLLGNAGADNLYGQAGNDILSGGLGFDILQGGAGNDTLIASGGDPLASASSYSGSGDDLTGDDYSGPGADVFRFAATAGYGTSSDAYYGVQFATGDLITDFGAGDKIQFARAMVGDGDALLENVALKAAAGGTFAKTAEMVIVQANMSELIYAYTSSWQTITASAVVTQIGTADAAFAVADKRLFVVDDGNDSAIFQFTSADTDAVVSAAELELIAVVNDVTTLSSTDFFLY